MVRWVDPMLHHPALGHVRWLGGGTGAGKTAITARLADAFGLRTYSTDAAIRPHGLVPGPDTPLLSAFSGMNMDERWVRRTPQTMLETFPWFRGERFDSIVTDLVGQPRTPMMIAEGFRLLPRLVHPLLDEPWHAVWLISTPGFRRRVFERRPPADQFWLRTSDPALAFERLLERDERFAQQVADEAVGLGLKVFLVDGTTPEADLAAEVAHWLRLPAPPHLAGDSYRRSILHRALAE